MLELDSGVKYIRPVMFKLLLHTGDGAFVSATISEMRSNPPCACACSYCLIRIVAGDYRPFHYSGGANGRARCVYKSCRIIKFIFIGRLIIFYCFSFFGEKHVSVLVLWVFVAGDGATMLARVGLGELSKPQPIPAATILTRCDLFITRRGRIQVIIWPGRGYRGITRDFNANVSFASNVMRFILVCLGRFVTFYCFYSPNIGEIGFA